MANLNFANAIGKDFDSGFGVVYVKTTGQYVDGKYTFVDGQQYPVTATVQPLTPKEIDFLERGGRRIVDARKIYINPESTLVFDLNGYFLFDGAKWKPVQIDNRPIRSYIKCVVIKEDKR